MTYVLFFTISDTIPVQMIKATTSFSWFLVIYFKQDSLCNFSLIETELVFFFAIWLTSSIFLAWNNFCICFRKNVFLDPRGCGEVYTRGTDSCLSWKDCPHFLSLLPWFPLSLCLCNLLWTTTFHKMWPSPIDTSVHIAQTGMISTQ